MRSIKFGLAVVAALMFSVAMTASASAAEFLSSAKRHLLLEGVQSQNFDTKAGEVKCTGAKILSGESSGAPALVQLAEIQYEKCMAFGFIPMLLKLADYLFFANGKVMLDNEVIIVGGGCEVKVPSQNVGLVKYSNTTNKEGNKNIKLEPNVTGILYTAKSCPTGNGEFKDGTYTGNSELMIISGSLTFDP